MGKNGSGKSNLFFAIEFVLSDKYATLRREQRQALLHEGSGVDTVMSAFVELVFDNSEGRFPVSRTPLFFLVLTLTLPCPFSQTKKIDKEEVVLRRTIGLKKDEYFLNRKHTTKSDVMNLLESAGFSRSNPYYIVKQGKIDELSTMGDEARLELVKEIAGTNVYEKKRQESEKILAETTAKKEQIENVLKYIEERLTELEEEQQELLKYQKLDKEKRALEHSIYTKELNYSVEKLRQNEEKRKEKSEEIVSVHREKMEASDAVEKSEVELKKLKSELSELNRRKENQMEEKKVLLHRKAKLELEIQDFTAKFADETSTNKQIKSSLSEINKLIEEQQTKLKSLEKQQSGKQAELKELNEQFVLHSSFSSFFLFSHFFFVEKKNFREGEETSGADKQKRKNRVQEREREEQMDRWTSGRDQQFLED